MNAPDRYQAKGGVNVTLKSASELADEVLAEFMAPPLVTLDSEGYFNFRHPEIPTFGYDFKVHDACDALSWVAHMAEKRWVSTEHLQQFAALAMKQFRGE